MLYFAYGSNMCLPRLRDRVTDIAFITIGKLKGWRLVFNKRGRDDSAKANIVEIRDASNRSVWGVVFDIPEQRWDGLRKAERFPDHYSEREVNVATPQGAVMAITYVGCREHLCKELKPFDWYLEHVVRGAQSFGLPDEYVAELLKIEAIRDSDVTRALRERRHWIA